MYSFYFPWKMKAKPVRRKGALNRWENIFNNNPIVKNLPVSYSLKLRLEIV